VLFAGTTGDSGQWPSDEGPAFRRPLALYKISSMPWPAVGRTKVFFGREILFLKKAPAAPGINLTKEEVVPGALFLASELLRRQRPGGLTKQRIASRFGLVFGCIVIDIMFRMRTYAEPQELCTSSRIEHKRHGRDKGFETTKVGTPDQAARCLKVHPT